MYKKERKIDIKEMLILVLISLLVAFVKVSFLW